MPRRIHLRIQFLFTIPRMVELLNEFEYWLEYRREFFYNRSAVSMARRNIRIVLIDVFVIITQLFASQQGGWGWIEEY